MNTCSKYEKDGAKFGHSTVFRSTGTATWFDCYCTLLFREKSIFVSKGAPRILSINIEMHNFIYQFHFGRVSNQHTFCVHQLANIYELMRYKHKLTSSFTSLRTMITSNCTNYFWRWKSQTPPTQTDASRDISEGGAVFEPGPCPVVRLCSSEWSSLSQIWRGWCGVRRDVS